MRCRPSPATDLAAQLLKDPGQQRCGSGSDAWLEAPIRQGSHSYESRQPQPLMTPRSCGARAHHVNATTCSLAEVMPLPRLDFRRQPPRLPPVAGFSRCSPLRVSLPGGPCSRRFRLTGQDAAVEQRARFKGRQHLSATSERAQTSHPAASISIAHTATHAPNSSICKSPKSKSQSLMTERRRYPLEGPQPHRVTTCARGLCPIPFPLHASKLRRAT